ncbi:hypothetical protein HID58_033160 [Brassica napus]|uniref:DNA-directed RNA polymerase n=1 Tax=Brassica napus TaxID=3708 RepID=A0ABQ8BYN5_BRANA|nr:hypothetical protein HID58_033160 [Brassica napus]
MQHILQSFHQLQEGISVRPITVCIRSVWDIRKHPTDNTQICIGFITHYLLNWFGTTKFVHIQGQLLEGRLFGYIQPNDPKNLTEGDIYEFLGFSVIHNSRHRKLTQLPYYIQIDQKTITSKVTDIGPIFLVPNIYSNSKSFCRCRRADILNTKKEIRTTQKSILMPRLQAADFSILQSKKDRKFKVVIMTSIIPKLFQGRIRDRAKACSKE